MAKFVTELDEQLSAFVARQRVFFVASAPREGRVNLSPKGIDTFRVLSARRVGYLDLTGSGNETAAHTLDNGRLTFMFCAFEGPALIVRIYARGRVVRPADAEWPVLRPSFGAAVHGERQLVIGEVESVQSSCGYGVPLFEHRGDRRQLLEWAERAGPAGVAQ